MSHSIKLEKITSELKKEKVNIALARAKIESLQEEVESLIVSTDDVDDYLSDAVYNIENAVSSLRNI